MTPQSSNPIQRRSALQATERFRGALHVLQDFEVADWFSGLCEAPRPRPQGLSDAVLADLEASGIVRQLNGEYELGPDGIALAESLGLSPLARWTDTRDPSGARIADWAKLLRLWGSWQEHGRGGGYDFGQALVPFVEGVVDEFVNGKGKTLERDEALSLSIDVIVERVRRKPPESFAIFVSVLFGSIARTLERALTRQVVRKHAIDVLAEKDDPDPKLHAALNTAWSPSAADWALADLSKIEKLVLRMYYFEEMPLYEIAKLLDVSTGHVSRVHRTALTKLRARMPPNERPASRP